MAVIKLISVNIIKFKAYVELLFENNDNGKNDYISVKESGKE